MATLTLTWPAGHISPPLEPNFDDQGRITVVVASSHTGEAVAVDETAAVAYRSKVDVNPADDSALPQHAAHHLALGTEAGPRYPKVVVNLDANPTLTAAVAALDVGDRLSLDGVPPELGRPFTDTLVLGYQEVIGSHSRVFAFNTARGGILSHVGVLDDNGGLQTAGAQLSSAITDTQTAFNVTTPAGPLFTFAPPAGARIIVRDREPMPVTSIGSSSVDNFSRSTSNNWGVADSGETWGHFGTLANISTTGTRGRHSHTALNAGLISELPVSWSDTEVQVDLFNSTLPTGGNFEFTVRSRFVGFNDFLDTRIQLNPTNAVSVSIRQVVANVATGTGPVMVPGLTATTTLRAVLSAQGGVLRVKVFDAAAAPPRAWTLEQTTTHLSAGKVQLISALLTGVTNALPVAMEFDSFKVNNPQRFTVTRDPALRMQHPAGGDVRVYRPLRLTL